MGWLAASGCVSTAPEAVKARREEVLASLPKTPTITLEAKDTPMDMVFERMSAQAGVNVIVVDPWLAGFPVSITLTQATLEQGIRKLLGNLDYALKISQSKGGLIKGLEITAKMPVHSRTVTNE